MAHEFVTGSPYYLSATAFGLKYRDVQAMYSEVSSAAEPVTLTEAKAHLRIDSGDPRDDSEVDELIAAARTYCERQTSRTIRQNVVRRVTLNQFPAVRYMPLWYPPLVDIVSVTYLDELDVPQTVDAADYAYIAADISTGVIEFSDAFNFPNTNNAINAVTIDYTAGYATLSEIPFDLKAAVKITMDMLWDHDAAPAVMRQYAERRDSLLETYDPGTYA